MKKVIFLSFDLGLKSDYENLYKWLDEKGAVERGYGFAYIKEYSVEKKIIKDTDFLAHVKDEIGKRVTIGANDRIYMVWNGIEDKERIRSAFVFGAAKQSPWTGFAQRGTNNLELEE